MGSPTDSKSGLKGVYSAPALEKGFSVIELLACQSGGMTVSEIAAGLGLSISEIFRIIVVMERSGWLAKQAKTDRYRVTAKVLDLAFRATPSENLAVVAAPLMRDLAYQVEQSCHMVVRNGERGLVMLRQDNPGPTVFAVRPGTGIDLYSTCSGQVLLAFAGVGRKAMPTSIQAELDKRPEIGPILAGIRERGYQTMASPRTLGVTDVSYPVFGFDGGIAAALTIPFLEMIDGTQSVNRDQARPHLAQTALRISVGLGWVARG